MDHTGANVYKGMVGLYPIYDPVLDFGDETDPTGLQLPGRRRDHGDGWFDVDYDVPLVFSDIALDDGVTNHQDMHDSMSTPRRGTRASIPSGGARRSTSISRTTASSVTCSRSTAPPSR